MELKARKREKTRGENRRLRSEGKIPAVVYGHHVETTSLVLDSHEFTRVLARAGHSQLVDLLVEGSAAHKVLIKEVQISPRRFNTVHVDFQQVSLLDKLQVDVPIVLHGEPELVRLGEADVLHVHHTLRVECLPTDIPEKIEIDISGLAEIDAGVYVRDLKLSEAVTVVTDEDELIVKLTQRRDMAAELAEEESQEAAATGADAVESEPAEPGDEAAGEGSKEPE
jgi:large subunit ribosomal protein L25